MVKQVGPGEGVSYGHRYRTERETTVATVPIGYADGVPVAWASSAGRCWSVPVAGRSWAS